MSMAEGREDALLAEALAGFLLSQSWGRPWASHGAQIFSPA